MYLDASDFPLQNLLYLFIRGPKKSLGGPQGQIWPIERCYKKCTHLPVDCFRTVEAHLSSLVVPPKTGPQRGTNVQSK